MPDPRRPEYWAFEPRQNNEGALYLYGEIAADSLFGDEETPKKFKDDMDALGDIGTLHVYINSAGGDVFAGWNIINLLKRHPARKIGYNDGLAASIAFDILMSMDEVVAMNNSLFMTHNCWAYIRGNRHVLREQAERMEKIDLMRAETAARRSGKTIEAIIALQDAETWYTATEAVAEGFVDSIHQSHKLAACLTGDVLAYGDQRFDLGGYGNRGECDRAIARILPQEGDEGNLAGCLSATPHGHGTGINLNSSHNGGASQPVEDTAPSPAAMETRRNIINRIRKKLAGGYACQGFMS